MEEAVFGRDCTVECSFPLSYSAGNDEENSVSVLFERIGRRFNTTSAESWNTAVVNSHNVCVPDLLPPIDPVNEIISCPREIFFSG